MKEKLPSQSKNGQKIALYIRVSTEEQASNPEGSIKSQEQRLRGHVALKNLETYFGDVAAVFIDRARSGKDTNRPELQRMLRAIQSKEITLVMVTELSRLSRSIKDFCDIWELMRSHNCQFQSLREQFDTTTAAGEMVLYTIANIAQFERKQTSERISSNFRARAERGLTNGGSVPFGYQMNPEKKGYLLVKEEDAATVREIFATFLREGSLAPTGKSLNNRGFRLPKCRQGGSPRMGHFTTDNLHHLLTNRAYIGVRVYKVNGEQRTSKAVWNAIVDEVVFERTQAILKKNRRRLKDRVEHRFPYILSGLCACGVCGDAMTGKSAHGNGGKIPYYEHAWASRRQACLNKKVFDHKPRRILAKKIEEAVWGEVVKLLTDSAVAQKVIAKANEVFQAQGPIQEVDRLRSKTRGVEEQIEALAEHLSKIPKGLSPAPIYSQMQKLEELKSKSQAELDEILRSGVQTEPPVQLKDYQAYLTAVSGFLRFAQSPELKTKIIQRLVHKIEIYPAGFNVHFLVDKTVVGEPDKAGPSAGSPASQIFLVSGSKTLTNGGRHRARTYDLRRVKAAL